METEGAGAGRGPGPGPGIGGRAEVASGGEGGAGDTTNARGTFRHLGGPCFLGRIGGHGTTTSSVASLPGTVKNYPPSTAELGMAK